MRCFGDRPYQGFPVKNPPERLRESGHYDAFLQPANRTQLGDDENHLSLLVCVSPESTILLIKFCFASKTRRVQPRKAKTKGVFEPKWLTQCNTAFPEGFPRPFGSGIPLC
uniref:DDE Tnp4 domain-containing protein n=1 Tax=Steinernema glaseri TaxID=37863 RepID=A0A1I7ZUJ1_9BILA